jgi:hypothetical protein
MTKAFARDYEEGESFPYLDFMCEDTDKCLWYPCTETKYECWQPDEIEDAEFNLIILLHGFPVRVRGIHFDFIEEE